MLKISAAAAAAAAVRRRLKIYILRLLGKQKKIEREKIRLLRRSSVGRKTKALSKRKLCSIYSKFGKPVNKTL